MTPEEEYSSKEVYNALREYDPFKWKDVEYSDFLDWYEKARKLEAVETHTPVNQMMIF